jgi:hypothetical protein
VAFDKQQIAEMAMRRREAAERASTARDRGFIDIANAYERVVAGWDALLARHRVASDNKL